MKLRRLILGRKNYETGNDKSKKRSRNKAKLWLKWKMFLDEMVGKREYSKIARRKKFRC